MCIESDQLRNIVLYCIALYCIVLYFIVHLYIHDDNDDDRCALSKIYMRLLSTWISCNFYHFRSNSKSYGYSHSESYFWSLVQSDANTHCYKWANRDANSHAIKVLYNKQSTSYRLLFCFSMFQYLRIVKISSAYRLTFFVPSLVWLSFNPFLLYMTKLPLLFEASNPHLL